ncbi:hypothetical protein ABB37_03670 [Leptomonas pyrrhocoris]|uniref:Abnormal spindle-like microcephaly-associated protein ASH domain-containing protein n=1 Tax=Leptomonas pyrrhocoris TaxID=157538 RepID=A0A0M9G2W2_LEPPY|nr:hypothetical protein ABB37_03670 [Leptomonas pyrrhocoris]XP_015659693.1 hypothetical protein ABB37_03670 [Leptomonas pyrrhocoris]XP_015659694.1 hypothetical protein ABB37_03670 [Leptomonas pyrrhocoris]KPA81253.1 hypothetical protein ABB37_03670 [Leptomonas pyrrhocoris]KPA81254.1 hypothetical protein ABB37_03670 [Leptomonas pyrrhocoris]KPA81255.1 hypothetical protein ABB37_03670 [Leptomonas pyrrhocoris]|eukprot:XP_015659692.1 hypothetical protein ABB37_03670 [Leptomonas pyrrhocoris]
MTERSKMKERRGERQHALGIDCVDRLIWKEWTPGCEYTRKILVKNVDRASQTIKISLPVHRKILLTSFPEPVTLSSGVSHEISITFKPAELVELHDAITITVEGRGSFQVLLDCLTPYAKLSMPSSYDFDYCAIGSTGHAEVQLRNSGTAPVEFTWEAPAPFCILPKHAVLDQGEVMHLTLLFTPTDACTMVGQAVCRLTGMDEVIATLKVSGVGKYPFICFQDQDEQNDGGSNDTLIVKMEGKMNGSVSTKEVRLCNPSAVPATVRLRRSDDGIASAFFVTVEGAADGVTRSGEPFVVPRGATQTLRIHYTPGSAGVLQSSVFQIDCLEGNTLQLELSGTTSGPRVTTSLSSVDFGAVDLEHLPTKKQRTRHITLRNTSAIDASFAWVNTSPGAAFLVQPQHGTVPAQSMTQVAVTFQPSHPILYYRRLHLLVEGATDVAGVDVFGGAYNSTVRPPALHLADVEAALLRAERGLGLLTPTELENIAAVAAAEDDSDGNGGNDVSENVALRSRPTPHRPVAATTLEAWRRVEEDVRGTSVVMRGAKHKCRSPLNTLEAINGHVAVNNPFGLDAHQLYTFTPRHNSNVQRGSTNDGRGQIVTVMNTSDVSAVATWSVPGPSCPYSVTPAQQVIDPNSSATFQLQCNLSSADDYAALCTLECYVNFESMSAFYLAPDNCVVPPCCFTVTCTTSSGVASSLPKQAQATVASQIRAAQQVCLPACRLGGSSYQVITLHNKGATAARYEVNALQLKQVSAVVLPPDTTLMDPPASQQDTDVDGTAFSVFPPVGVVPPRARQLLVVKFRPSEAARYEAAATLSWNSSTRATEAAASPTPGDATAITLFGEVCLPQLQWRNACDTAASEVVFPPSCITGEAQQQAWVRNTTALPVSFRFDTSVGLLGVLRMEPEWAVVPGGARLPVTLFFSPQHPRVFSGFLQLYLEDGATDAVNRQLYRQKLPFYGEGAYADVEVEPRVIDVGEAPDTQEQQATLTLYNSGICDVQYDVRAMRIDAAASQQSVIVPRLHNSRGVLPARTHTTVLAAGQPTPGLTEFVLYAVISGLSTDLGEVPDAESVAEAERHPHCRWSLRAAHPAVQVVNVKFPGVARPLAWQQLNLNAVNAQLAAVNDADAGADVFSFQHYVSGLVPLTMDLGVAHEMTPAVCLTVTLQNTGDCPSPFSLMFPTQHDANTEHWCLENTELADLQYIVDRGIIAVTPSQGVINVGGTVQLQIAYTHEEVGVHRLPMLLRVGAGERRVAVVLEGRTLPPEVQVLNFHHEKVYELLPVALGDMEPPLQYVTVSNPCDEPVEYTVDVTALQAHAKSNYGFPVFQCADPHGCVPPHTTASIGFYFRPLEARHYQITVLVQTAQGEGYYVDLVGTGYNTRVAPKTSVVQWVEDSLMHVPVVPPLIPHASSLRLVEDVCTLGAVAYYTLCRRICTLQLAAEAQSAVRYAWQLEQPRHGDAQLVIHPAEGVLQPGEQQTVQVSFYAGSTSQVLEHLVSCLVAPCTSAAAPLRDERTLQASSHLERRPRSPRQKPSSASLRSAESLGLLVQARVMPRDDYELLYGKARLAAAYMPALYRSHVDPMSPAAVPSAAEVSVKGGVAKEEARFVTALVDELIRTVVASPSVQESFTTLCPPRFASYAKMRVLHATAAGSGPSKKGAKAEKSNAAAASTAAPAAKGGNFTAAVLTEGVLEELLRNLLSEGVAAA